MTKNQKIWLAVSLALFTIPELLWPQFIVVLFYWAREFIFGISLKAGEIAKFDLFSYTPAPQLTGVLILSKSIGLLLSFIITLVFYKSNYHYIKLLIIMILGLLLFAVGYYILFLINFHNISIG